MLSMTATFALLGAVLGLASGLYAVGLRRRERQVARLAGGSHALTTTRVSGPPPGDVTAWTSNGVSGRGGGPPMFLPVRSKTPLWQ